MTRVAWIDGTRVQLAPAQLLGEGGEAEVYELGDGRVLKLWKRPDHPDFAGLPDVQAAVGRRLAEQPAKLRALPGALPAAVVAPSGFALASKRAAAVVGYVMAKVVGEPLHSLGEPRWQRDHPIRSADAIAVLLALHDAIAGLHRAGVVIGDCNDLNVLVDGTRVHLIDVDSYQYGGFTCPMFSERFVDPRLCDAHQLVPVRPHDTDSDWFAFAVMALRTLLGVGPWGGVAKHCPPGARALRRASVLGDDIVYPRAARPLAVLPDDVRATFRAIFERDQRGVFPRLVLEQLALRSQPAAPPPMLVTSGDLRWEVLASGTAFATIAARADTVPVRIADGAVWRHTRWGDERVGSVLSGQTRVWFGAKLGVGFYRAGGYTVGFVFRPDRGALDDRVAMPAIRGRLIDAHATVGDDRAWLWLTCVDAGRITTTCIVIAADARVLATETLGDVPWLAGAPGACAAGPHLFVPTDDGIVRVEIVHGAIAVTRVFAETAPLVGAADRLALHSRGIDVIRHDDAIRMWLT